MKIEDVWQDWNVEKKIGRGSFGTVYKCFKEEDGTREYAAIKVISVPGDDIELQKSTSLERMTAEQSKAFYKEIVDGFVKEIEMLESLKGHPNIVQIEDSKVVECEDTGWQIFIRMELLTDFNAYSCDRTFGEKDVIRIASDLASALKACAEKNVVHRDIKPENIFVDDYGNFKLGDFGVAKQLERTETAMSRRGTPNYMAPEVFNAQKGDSRADIYSLGIVMYQLLNNNRFPFTDPNKQFITHSEREAAFKRRMINGEKLPELPNVSPEVNAIILKATQFKKEDRFKNINEFYEALEEVSGKKKSARIRRLGWSRKRKAAIAALALLLVLAIGTGVFTMMKPDWVSQVFSRIHEEMITDEEAAVLLGENLSYKVLNSGLVSGVFSGDNVDYFADANGFHKCGAEGDQVICEQYCSNLFSIVKDKIYFSVLDGKTYHCWAMDLNGKQQQQLFDYQNNGVVVYATENGFYYLDKTKDEKGWTLYYYRNEVETEETSADSPENPSLIQANIANIAFIKRYLVFNLCGEENYDKTGNRKFEGTETYRFDLLKQNAVPELLQTKVLFRDDACQLTSIKHQHLLAFAEQEKIDGSGRYTALGVLQVDADSDSFEELKIKEGAFLGFVDRDTISLKLIDGQKEKLCSYDLNKKKIKARTNNTGLAASVEKSSCYVLEQTNLGKNLNVGGYYLERIGSDGSTYTDELDIRLPALIGQNVILWPTEDDASVYAMLLLNDLKWDKDSPEELDDEKILKEPVEAFLYNPDQHVANLRSKPDRKSELIYIENKATLPDKTVVMRLSEEVNGYCLCEHKSTGIKCWIYADLIHDGRYGVEDNLFYEAKGRSIIITGGSTELQTIEIPEKIIGYNVTAIGDSAFYSSQLLKEMTLPRTVTTIGDSAFENCEKLQNITLPDQLTTLGRNAFRNTGITKVKIPYSLNKIADATFSGCSALERVELPSVNKFTIERNAFEGCKNLGSISPDPAKWSKDWNVDPDAFYGCKTDYAAVYLDAKKPTDDSTTTSEKDSGGECGEKTSETGSDGPVIASDTETTTKNRRNGE